MAQLAKCYVLGVPFQSHRASERMTAAINQYVDELSTSLGEMTDVADGSQPCVGDAFKLKLGRSRNVLGKLAEMQPKLFPNRQ